MIVKECTITNRNGDSIRFGRHFKLIEGLDLSKLSAAVNYSENASDGAYYQNSRLNVRDFDLSFYIDIKHREKWWVEERRQELFRVLNPKQNPMRLDFETKGGSKYFINVNVSSAPTLPQGFENDNRAWQKGLIQFISTDPFIYDSNETKIDIAQWVGAFEFPLELVEDGIEMGYRQTSLTATVDNHGQNEIGMEMRFIALSTVVNPKLINVNTYEEFQLDIEMQGGDVIDVNTHRGKRSITLTRNNVKTNIFNNLNLNSTFLQLYVGDNTFRYDADSGIEQLEVSVKFTNSRIGV